MNAQAGNGFGPLAGVKVLELGVFMAAPTCGLMLADLGADVIKIEKMPNGEDTRGWTPLSIGGQSAAFSIINRNKRAIAIDLKREEGLGVFRRLAKSSDIVIENFRPGAMEKLGLSAKNLIQDNPALIYGAISGFGRTGPLADRGGLDLIAQGFSGLMAITGEGPGRPPVKVGAPVCDTTAGMLLALGVVSAYVNRLKTGRGQIVETSLLEAAMSHTYWQAAIFLATGVSSQPMGSAHPLSAPYQAYRCADGYIVLGAPNQSNWIHLCQAIGAEELLQNPLFSDPTSRRSNNEALASALEPVFSAHDRQHWIERLEQVGVPCGPVNSIGEAMSHPQTLARRMVVDIGDGGAGSMKSVGCPIKLSETDSRVARGAPIYGGDTKEVLIEAGFSAKEIDTLRTLGAIYFAD